MIALASGKYSLFYPFWSIITERRHRSSSSTLQSILRQENISILPHVTSKIAIILINADVAVSNGFKMQLF